LADFQSVLKDFENEGIKIVAGSVDPLDKTEAFVEKLALSYPVAYGMDMETTCAKTGVFYEKDRKFIQPSCFLLRPDKTIEVAVYSSGPIGRFVPQDVLGLVRFYKNRAQK
jgi:peroxiredoxin